MPKAESPNVSLTPAIRPTSTTPMSLHAHTSSFHDSAVDDKPPSPLSSVDSTFTPSSSSSSSHEEESAPRVPRPPNAFMLFRSHFLREKIVPVHAEKRQQALSKVAGECWNMLSEVQKEEWKQKAAEEMRKHRELYPDYRFNPAPKGSRKAKGKDGKDEKDEENTRKLRETYVGMTGPAPMGSREKRKQNSKKNKHFGRRAFPLEVSFQEYRPVSDAVPPTPLAYGSGSESGSRLPPNFPQPSYPHLPYDQLQHPDSQYPTLGHPASETPLHTAPKSKSSEADSTESGCGLRLDPQITPNDQWYQYGESMLGSSTHTSYEQYQEEYQGQFKEQLNNNNNVGSLAAFSTSQQEPLIPVPATATFDDQHTTYYYPQLALENWDLERGDAAQYDVLQNYYASLTGFSWSTPGWEFNGWQPC